MEREREQERDRDDGFVDARPTHRDGPRVGVWILQAERELGMAREHLTTGKLNAGDECRSLEDRFRLDTDIIKSIPGLRQEVWAQAEPETRLQTLRELEGRLATSQGREARRVYSADYLNDAGVTIDRSAETSHAFGLLAGKYIHLDHPKLDTSEWTYEDGLDVKLVCATVFEECRHAYQLAVLGAPERHPEVDDSTRQLWHTAKERYPEDSKTPQGYEQNGLEVDAKGYAKRMLDEVYG